MKFNTALGLVLAGLAAIAMSHQEVKACRILVYVNASLVAGLGAVTLSEYVLSWDAGIDNFFFREVPATSGASFPGRMAPHSAVCFLLLGLAMMSALGRFQVLQMASGLLLGCIAFIALAALAGHLYGAVYFYGLSQYTGMAVHTAVAFLALCAAVFLARSMHGPPAVILSSSSGGVISRRLLPAAIFVPLLLGLLQLLGQDAGFYDAAAGMALLATSSMVVFALLIGWSARMLHQLDMSRREAELARDRTIEELRTALDEVRTLRGLIPMCAWCKKIRDDGGFWNDVAAYLSSRTEAEFSHGICPACSKVHFPDSE